MLSVKTKEHIRRHFAAGFPKWGTLFGGMLMLAATVTFTGMLLRTVTITDSDGQSGTVITAAQQLDTLFAQTGVEPAGTNDKILVTEEGGVDGIRVMRACTVSLTADGSTRSVITTGTTVAQALQEAGVSMNAEDEIEPALDTAIDDGTQITLRRVTYQESTEQQVIPSTTEYKYTSVFSRNQTLTWNLRDGSDGADLVTYRSRYVDGQLTDTEEIGRKTLVPMVTQLIKCYGAGGIVSDYQGPEIVDDVPASGVAASYTACSATGYSSSRYAKGASGRKLTYGTVAVNPAVIPYGSLMYITSADGSFVYGYAYAADTGAAMLNGTAFIDLYYETYDESVMNAVRSVNVYVLDAATAAQYKDANDALLEAELAQDQ